jgi:hypothetical protein
MNRGFCAIAALVIVCMMQACATAPLNENGFNVVGMPNHQAYGFDADFTVKMLRQAGFSKDEILQVGTRVRNLLAQYGGAQVRLGQKVVAIFAVDQNNLYIVSRRSGTNILNLPEDQSPN